MDNKQKDLLFDKPIGGMKKIKPVPGMKQRAPKISWGEIYKGWSIEKRLEYAERLASTMNHAADILQTQSINDKQTIAHQENQLKQAAIRYAEQGEFVHTEMAKQDAEKQQLYTEIVKLASEIKELKKKLKK